MKKTKGIILITIMIILLFCMIIVGIQIYNFYKYQNTIEDKEKRFDKIKIIYDYGSIVPYSDTYEEPYTSAYEIDVQGEDLEILQNILKKYDFEDNKYKIEDTGHYHGLTFYSNIFELIGEYRVDFNDGSEMIINGNKYETQYRNNGNYYSINDCEDFIDEVLRIVNDEVYKEDVKIDTNKISISGITSGSYLEINDSKTINKILNEYRYVKDDVVSKDLIQSLLEQDKDDYMKRKRGTKRIRI